MQLRTTHRRWEAATQVAATQRQPVRGNSAGPPSSPWCTPVVAAYVTSCTAVTTGSRTTPSNSTWHSPLTSPLHLGITSATTTFSPHDTGTLLASSAHCGGICSGPGGSAGDCGGSAGGCRGSTGGCGGSAGSCWQGASGMPVSWGEQPASGSAGSWPESKRRSLSVGGTCPDSMAAALLVG